jgi:hypothetical protein
MAEAPKHLRAQIRAALVALLKGKNSDVDQNVFSGRARPLTAAQIPAADVDMGRGENRSDGGRIDAGDGGMGPSEPLRRYPVLLLAVTVEQNDGFLDALDAIYKDYEIAIAEDNTLGGLCVAIKPLGEPAVMIAAEGKTTVARGEMPFEVEYITAFNAPTQAA